jgi:RNA polymerase sigma-70 factor, ECF subfamily
VVAVPSERLGLRLDQDAFAARVQSCSALLCSIASGVTGDRVGAEDIVQEASVIALGKLDEFDPATSFRAWMGQIVRNVARNAARQHRQRKTEPASPEAFERASPAPVEELSLSARGDLAESADDFDAVLLEALRSLDELPRICLLLRTVHALPYRDLARILDIPEGTAMSHVHRARTLLRQRLLAADRQAPHMPLPRPRMGHSIIASEEAEHG